MEKLKDLEQQPVRGFIKVLAKFCHFGLGESTQIDSIQLFWPKRQKKNYLQILTAIKHSRIKQNNSFTLLSKQISKINTKLALLTKTVQPFPI